MGNIDKEGYIRICGNKQVMLHRAIMEEIIGRKLKHNELVHHKNGDKFDSRPSNLEIVSRSKQIWYKKCGVTPQAICMFKKKHREVC